MVSEVRIMISGRVTELYVVVLSHMKRAQITGKYMCMSRLFLTDIEKTQGKNNSPNSITQGNFPSKTQRTGSIFDWTKKLNEPVLI